LRADPLDLDLAFAPGAPLTLEQIDTDQFGSGDRRDIGFALLNSQALQMLKILNRVKDDIF
jgi:hypothetical protein